MEKLTFEQAYKRLEEISDELSKGDFLSIEKIVELQKEAKVCYAFCKNVMSTVDLNQ